MSAMDDTATLVLGGSGFVGRHLVARLAAAGRRVIVPTRQRERAKHLILLPTVDVVEVDIHNEAVLATAAYNAGPGRAQAWRGAAPMEGAIYAESIPFNETRDYVKKVLANAMFYQAQLGLPYVALRERLGVVPPKGGNGALSEVASDRGGDRTKETP